ncbi:MAG: IS66 family insertion sequence element accessory protein TnpB [Colwellia sp.]|nr:IS66 family insertion sequence element accessory protein TnpB [Colwellia sp.]
MNKQQKIKHWKNIFAQQQRSDLTIIQFCRVNNVNVSTFYAWRKRLSDKALPVKQQQVIPLVIHAQSSMIKLTTPSRYQLNFESTLKHQTLAQLLSV